MLFLICSQELNIHCSVWFLSSCCVMWAPSITLTLDKASLEVDKMHFLVSMQLDAPLNTSDVLIKFQSTLLQFNTLHVIKSNVNKDPASG